MIALVKNSATAEQLAQLVHWIEQRGLKAHVSHGVDVTIVGLVGDTTRIDPFLLESMDLIERVQRVSEPFKLVGRSFHPTDTIVDCGHQVRVGDGSFQLIARITGKTHTELVESAQALKCAGATMLEADTHQSLASPHFDLDTHGITLDLLLESKAELDMPIIAEITDVRDIGGIVDRGVDVMRVAARNAQNVALLHEVGKSQAPVLLEHGMGNTINELLMAAEHIVSEGNTQVILCECGMRGFDERVPHTFDVNQITALRQLTHLPIIASPDRETTSAQHVLGAAFAAAAVDASGVTLAVNTTVDATLKGMPNTLSLNEFVRVAHTTSHIREALVVRPESLERS